MPSINAQSAIFRAALLANDSAAANDLIVAYGHVWQRIHARLTDLTTQIQAVRNAGGAVNLAWLFQEQRLQRLQDQTEEEIAGFAQQAAATITASQRQAVEAAQEHARQLTLLGMGEPPTGVTLTWAHLPVNAVRDAIGFSSDGSPLRILLDQLGPAASQAVRSELIEGVALGQGPRVVAARIRQALGGNLVRALTISRTEVLRSYRTANLRSYQANSDVVKAWRWQAALSNRTCPSCLALDGTIHSLDEPFGSHPRCRCVPVPITRTWAELGYPGVRSPAFQRQTGADWFANQPAATQRKILGIAAHKAYEAGDVALKDFIGTKHSTEWGTMHYARSLRDVLGEKEARAWIRKALAA